MQRFIFVRLIPTVLVIFLMMLGGCARTQPAKVYLLHSLSEGGKMTTEGETVPNLTIGVGPVEVPKYLDRPQIVTRTSQNELQLAEFDRWAEPLQDNVTRVLAENLSILLGTHQISVFPMFEATKIDYQVIVVVTRFEGDPNGAVSLTARWTIAAERGKKKLVTKASSINEPAGGQGYNALVAAKSRAVGALSKEIAKAIKALKAESLAH